MVTGGQGAMDLRRYCTLSHAVNALLFTSVVAGLALTLLGIVNPTQTRVLCDDTTIRHTYHGDTISIGVLIAVTVFLPFVVMCIIEWAVPPQSEANTRAAIRNTNGGLRGALARSKCYWGDIVIGELFMFFLNDLLKTTVGEARPHFWHTCWPNITDASGTWPNVLDITCKEPILLLTWENCTNPLNLSHPRLIDSMKSFPSGHASLSVFSSVFLICYFKQRLWDRLPRLVSLWLGLVWATWTVLCCQSRLWDNRHHWWDVLAGGLLGGVCSLLTVHYMCNWFVRDPAERSRGMNDSGRRLVQNDNDYREMNGINGAAPA